MIAAAGTGLRFGAPLPKQYAELLGRPVVARTLERLEAIHAEETLVALAPADEHYGARIGDRPGIVPLTCGGATRGETIRNALVALSSRCGDDDWVLVHDAARPCVPRDALARLVVELEGDPVGGLLALPLSDTLKRAADVPGLPRVARTETRDGSWLAQTPQMFRYRLLASAYERADAVRCTDDSEAIEWLAATGACRMPRLVRGSVENLKITEPGDLELAAAILAAQGDA